MGTQVGKTQVGNKKRVAAVAATLTIITLTACGGSGQAGGAGTGNVASLPPSPGAVSSSAGTAGQAGQSGPAGLGGVTLPDNASPAETARIMNAWASCMGSHGDSHFAAKQGHPDGVRVPTVSIDKFPAAVKACRSLQPHAPWQELPQYNPNYQRDFARDVNCMNARGVPVKAVPGGWTFNGTSSLSEAQQEQVTVECEMQAFNES
jgi:hypothetical protein